MKTILAAVDFSDVTETVVTQAAALARSSGGRVVLLNVVQPPVVTTEYAPFIENVEEIAAAAEKSAARRLTELKQQFGSSQIEIDVLQLAGAPVPNIVKEARARGAEYIVMGSHGHTALYDLLVGSTTHGVLLRSPCPVVIVPSNRKRRD